MIFSLKNLHNPNNCSTFALEFGTKLNLDIENSGLHVV